MFGLKLFLLSLHFLQKTGVFLHHLVGLMRGSLREWHSKAMTCWLKQVNEKQASDWNWNFSFLFRKGCIVEMESSMSIKQLSGSAQHSSSTSSPAREEGTQPLAQPQPLGQTLSPPLQPVLSQLPGRSLKEHAVQRAGDVLGSPPRLKLSIQPNRSCSRSQWHPATQHGGLWVSVPGLP